jgi:release factor glutamine methyltransferase
LPLATTDRTVTVRELLAHGRKQLAHIDSGLIDSEVLLCAVLEQQRHYLFAHADAGVSVSELADFNSLIAKRAAGFPVAYLTGKREFWSLPLQVNQHTLIPRPETERLVELTLESIPAEKNVRVLDLGTGSGAIAIAIARERPACTVTAIDISQPALAMAQQNATRLGINNIRFIHSDWFSATTAQSYDLIVSNPPYVESGDSGFVSGDIRYEPRIALDGGVQGLEAYRRIIPAAIGFLVSGGRLLFEHGHTQGEPVRQLFLYNRYRDIQTFQDYAGLDRITLATLP